MTAGLDGPMGMISSSQVKIEKEAALSSPTPYEDSCTLIDSPSLIVQRAKMGRFQITENLVEEDK